MSTMALPFVSDRTAPPVAVIFGESPFLGTTVIEAHSALAPLPAALRVAGVPFEVREEGGLVLLVHPRWSLEGVGATVDLARENLLTAAMELAESLEGDEETNLSADARELLQFVRTVA